MSSSDLHGVCPRWQGTICTGYLPLKCHGASAYPERRVVELVCPDRFVSTAPLPSFLPMASLLPESVINLGFLPDRIFRFLTRLLTMSAAVLLDNYTWTQYTYRDGGP